MATTSLIVGKDKNVLATVVVKRVVDIARQAIEERGAFNVAVSGGSMPKILAGLSEIRDIEWKKWKIFFADERCVPLDDDDSNYNAWGFLSSTGIPPENIIAVDTALSPEDAATDYSARLKDTFGEEGGDNCFPAFDAALLGMGPDGHTCSLFPGHPLLEEQQKWVAHIEDSPKPPPARITLTYPVLNCAQNVMFVGTGESKAALLPQLIKFSDPSGLHAAGAASPYPAARVEPLSGTLTYYVDAAAAAECPPEVKAAAQVL